jgi:hypothetical protein
MREASTAHIRNELGRTYSVPPLEFHTQLSGMPEAVVGGDFLDGFPGSEKLPHFHGPLRAQPKPGRDSQAILDQPLESAFPEAQSRRQAIRIKP